MDYFREQLEFIQSLTEREQFIVKTYTFWGAYVINNLFRFNWGAQEVIDWIDEHRDDFKRRFNIFEPIPLDSINKENCLKIAKDYVSEFNTIFAKAPVMSVPMRLFRGIQPTPKFDPRRVNVVSPTVEYLSTTYSTYERTLDIFAGDPCCIMEFMVQPGVRTLWVEPVSIHPYEAEIVLDKGVALYNSCRPKDKNLAYEDWDNDEYGVSDRDINVFEYEVRPYKSLVKRVFRMLCGVRGGTRKNHKSRGSRKPRKTGKRGRSLAPDS